MATRAEIAAEQRGARSTPSAGVIQRTAHAYVDDAGYVYDLRKRGGGVLYPLLLGALCLLIGALGIMHRFGIPYEAALAPLPTAGIARSTPPPAARVNDVSVPAAQPSDYGVSEYNARQERRAAEFAQEASQEAPRATEVPSTDNHEAEIDAWLAAPPSTPTPLPAPGEEGFVESFEEAPQCSPFIGYLPNDPCVAILKQQAGEE